MGSRGWGVVGGGLEYVNFVYYESKFKIKKEKNFFLGGGAGGGGWGLE